MKQRPLIGIACQYIKSKRDRDVLGVNINYARSVYEAGADVVILNPMNKNMARIVSQLDGLMLVGGDDIHPKFYHEKIKKNIEFSLSPDERTLFEMRLLKKYLKTKKPFLGICLGCQTLNVVMGGTLIQDIPSLIESKINHRLDLHQVLVHQDTHAFNIFKSSRFKINTNHHQAIGQLGRQLLISAVSPDGVVEAIELKGHPFALGIQWHPEETRLNPQSKRLFLSFVRAVKYRMKKNKLFSSMLC